MITCYLMCNFLHLFFIIFFFHLFFNKKDLPLRYKYLFAHPLCVCGLLNHLTLLDSNTFYIQTCVVEVANMEGVIKCVLENNMLIGV